MKIERSALVLHSAANMYALVQDVPSYTQFLSWCIAAEVHHQTAMSQEASLAVSIAGMEQRFTTLNQLIPGHSVQMQLLEGPFKDLLGKWSFIPLGEDGSKVSLVMDFHMTKGPMAGLFGRGFGKIADRLVDDFCKRADEVYC
jgi:ribosome-associated toxin RatA of RatAB toxin-antitoxin module